MNQIYNKCHPRSDEIINVRVFLANVWKNNLYKFYTR